MRILFLLCRSFFCQPNCYHNTKQSRNFVIILFRNNCVSVFLFFFFTFFEVQHIAIVDGAVAALQFSHFMLSFISFLKCSHFSSCIHLFRFNFISFISQLLLLPFFVGFSFLWFHFTPFISKPKFPCKKRERVNERVRVWFTVFHLNTSRSRIVYFLFFSTISKRTTITRLTFDFSFLSKFLFLLFFCCVEKSQIIVFFSLSFSTTSFQIDQCFSEK